MKHKFLSLALLATVFSFAFSSCGEDKPDIPAPPEEKANCIIINGERKNVISAFMGYAETPGMATAIALSIKDLDDPSFSKINDLITFEIREKFLGSVTEGEVTEIVGKSDFILKENGVNTPIHKGVEGFEYTFRFREIGRDNMGINLYEIFFKFIANKGTKDEKKGEFTYYGAVKTGGKGDIYNDDLKTYTEGGKINKPKPKPELESFISINGGKKQKLNFAAMGYSAEEGMKTDIVLLGNTESKNIHKAKISIIIPVANNIIENPDDTNLYEKIGLRIYSSKEDNSTRSTVIPKKKKKPTMRWFTNTPPFGNHVTIKKEGGNGKATIYSISFKFKIIIGGKRQYTLEGKYKGTLKTGGTGDVYTDNLEEYTDGGKITTPEPEPEPGHIEFEVEPEGNLSNVTYPFSIEGTNIFLDKNNNGTKDSGEELPNKYDGDLSLPKVGGKATYVIRGNIRSISFNTTQDGIFYFDRGYTKIKNSKLDAPNAHNTEVMYFGGVSMSEVKITGAKKLERLYLYDNKLKEIDVRGLNELTSLSVSRNNLSGNLDLSSNRKLSTISAGQTNISSIVLPNSESLLYLYLNETPIQSIDLSKCVNLRELSCILNKSLKTLDISNCEKLTRFDVSRCYKLQSITDSRANEGKPNLKTISISETGLELINFDFSKYTGLEKVYAKGEIGISARGLIKILPVAKDKKGIIVVNKTNADFLNTRKDFKDKGWTATTK